MISCDLRISARGLVSCIFADCSFFGTIALIASPSSAAILFDDFNSQAAKLDWNGGANFTVTAGSVDLVTDGMYGIRCIGLSGGCVDLIGSEVPPATSGTLISIALNLNPGVYNLSFDYSGNQRGAAASSFTGRHRGADIQFRPARLAARPSRAFRRVSRSIPPGSYNPEVRPGPRPRNEGNIIDNVSLAAISRTSKLGDDDRGLRPGRWSAARRRSLSSMAV